MKNSKKKKMYYGHGGGYNKPMQKAKKGMKYRMGGKGPKGPNPKGPTQAMLDKQLIQIKNDMKSGKLSPDDARKKLAIIQKRMQEIVGNGKDTPQQTYNKLYRERPQNRTVWRKK